MNILLTDHSNLFTRDWWLPSGDLRDAPSSYRRADIIIVTKCPEELSEEERRAIVVEIGPLSHQRIFFTSICYGEPYLITGQPAGGEEDVRIAVGAEDGRLAGAKTIVNDQVEVLLVTGIANPAPLKRWLDEHSRTYYELEYGDHHIFSIDDLNTMTRRFDSLTAGRKIILTTEKDAVRLTKFRQELEGLPFYVLPITPRFLFGEEPVFNDLISKFIVEFKEEQDER
jgi:tetraacyldisaccharide 4'-kinase